MFTSAPQDTRRVVEFGRPDAMNPEVRWTANLLTKALAYGVGVPSLVATAFVGAVGEWYAWIYSSGLQTFFGYAIGLLVIAVWSSCLPIAWANSRGNDPIVARAAFGLWAACVFMNVVTMLHFVRHVPAAPPVAVQAAAPARPAVNAPNLPEDEIERLDDKISELWYLVNDYGQELETAAGARRERLLTAESKRRYALARTELEQLEIRRYGAPIVLEDPDISNPRSRHAPGDPAAPTPSGPPPAWWICQHRQRRPQPQSAPAR